ncbi:MAG: hypothetical protein OZ934_01225 [Anaerolineae bacterium]|nr:hypothetical protein [Anaerolineae bacterium]
MELIALWKVVKRRWWLIVLPAAVVLVLTLPALADALNPLPRYEVRVRLTAAAPPDAANVAPASAYEDTSYVVWLASEYVAVNLPHWIASDSFAEEVAQVVAGGGLNIAASDLFGAFAAESYRSIVTLYVRWDDPAEINTIARAAIRVLRERNAEYFPQFAVSPARVVPLDSLEVAQVPAPLTSRIGPLLRLALGLAAGVGLAGLAEYLDRSLRTRQDVEALGLEVLAEIPGE